MMRESLWKRFQKSLYRIERILYAIGIYEVLVPFDREPFCYVRPDFGVIGPMFSREIKREAIRFQT